MLAVILFQLVGVTAAASSSATCADKGVNTCRQTVDDQVLLQVHGPNDDKSSRADTHEVAESLLATDMGEKTRTDMMTKHGLTQEKLSNVLKQAIESAVGFDTGEHGPAGNGVTMSDGRTGSQKFTTAQGFKLGYGDVMTLAGDWYGHHDAAICDGSSDADMESRFKNSFSCLDNDPKDPNRIFAYADHCDDPKCPNYDPPSGCSEYIDLASNNYDHFASMTKYSASEQLGGYGAWEAYSAGHRVACREAAEGSLEKALMHNAFASHFLSDLFSSGHLRQGRRGFNKFGESVTHSNNLLSKATHDEDSMLGLNVRNSRGDQWKMFGDGCYNSTDNTDNRKFHMEAITASANLVIAASTTGDSQTCIADAETNQITPQYSDVQDPDMAKALGNHAVLTLPATGSCGCLSFFGTCYRYGSGKWDDMYTRADLCNQESDDSYDKDEYTCYNALDNFAKLQSCAIHERGNVCTGYTGPTKRGLDAVTTATFY